MSWVVAFLYSCTTWLCLDLKKQQPKKPLPHDKVFKLYVNSNSCVNKITILLLKRLLKTFLLGSCQRVCMHSQGKRGSTHCIFFWHAWPWISSRLSWQTVNSNQQLFSCSAKSGLSCIWCGWITPPIWLSLSSIVNLLCNCLVQTPSSLITTLSYEESWATLSPALIISQVWWSVQPNNSICRLKWHVPNISLLDNISPSPVHVTCRVIFFCCGVYFGS